MSFRGLDKVLHCYMYIVGKLGTKEHSTIAFSEQT